MFSKETKIARMRDRQKLLAARDPAGNANIIAKLTRRIRQLEKGRQVMGRKFVIDEADLKEMLIALMEYHMNLRDGVDNWSWYGTSFHETVQDFYPEQFLQSARKL